MLIHLIRAHIGGTKFQIRFKQFFFDLTYNANEIIQNKFVFFKLSGICLIYPDTKQVLQLRSSRYRHFGIGAVPKWISILFVIDYFSNNNISIADRKKNSTKISFSNAGNFKMTTKQFQKRKPFLIALETLSQQWNRLQNTRLIKIIEDKMKMATVVVKSNQNEVSSPNFLSWQLLGCGFSIHPHNLTLCFCYW